MTKHHLQAAKHNISSDSLTPSGDGPEDEDVGDNFDIFSATCATSLDIKDKDVESICM